MKRGINEVELQFPEDREAFIESAISENETCVSVGGLADSLGMLSGPRSVDVVPTVGARAFATLIQFWRRQRQLSVEELASRAGVTATEVLDAEQEVKVPEPRVLCALGNVLEVSYEKLLLLTGHVAERDESLSSAALKFAARSESMERLSHEQEELLQDFIRVLVD